MRKAVPASLLSARCALRVARLAGRGSERWSSGRRDLPDKGVSKAETVLTSAAGSSNASTSSVEPDISESGIVFGSKDVMEMLRFQEQFSLLNVCVQTGDTRRAELMLSRLRESYPFLYRHFADAGIYNSFIRAHVDALPRPNTRRALDWYNAMRQAKLRATPTTFALLFRAAVLQEDADLFKVVWTEFMRAGFALRDVNELEEFSVRELCKLKQLLQLHGVPGAADLDHLTTLIRAADSASANSNAGAPTNPAINSESTTTSPASDILAVKSYGIQQVKRSLSAFGENSPDLYALQRRLELDAYKLALAEIQDETRGGKVKQGITQFSPIKELIKAWHADLVKGLTAKDALQNGNMLANDKFLVSY